MKFMSSSSPPRRAEKFGFIVGVAALVAALITIIVGASTNPVPITAGVVGGLMNSLASLVGSFKMRSVVRRYFRSQQTRERPP
jgi:hypothetical protein